jgi:hypothetical protein
MLAIFGYRLKALKGHQRSAEKEKTDIFLIPIREEKGQHRLDRCHKNKHKGKG